MNFDQLADQSSLDKTTSNLKTKGYHIVVVDTGDQALKKIKKLIPSGASIMNGSSVTLEQIGFVDLLKSDSHGWNDLHAQITAENDAGKRAQLRRQSILSDYYLGSVHALVESGEFIIASNTGSQLPHIVSTSPNLIFVVSTKKIVPDLDSAFKRLEQHVVPLEDQHMQDLYKIHTAKNKVLVFHGESPMTKRQIHFILVKQNLGF